MAAGPVAVYLEVGARRVFACALDWPGWCRSGRDEERALEALAAAAPRYAVAAREAGARFPARGGAAFDVVERIPGTASTDFGVPGEAAAADAEPLTRPQAQRQAALVAASWTILDRVAAGARGQGPRLLRQVGSDPGSCDNLESKWKRSQGGRPREGGHQCRSVTSSSTLSPTGSAGSPPTSC
jgi:hypothetical protein